MENKVKQSNEIEQTLGLLPHYYRIMAKDPENLEIIWNREKATMLEGKLGRKEKEFLAFAPSIVNGAFDSAKLHLELLRRWERMKKRFSNA